MSKIPYSQLEKGDRIIINKGCYEIIEASSMFKGRGHSTMQAKLKNLETGEVMQKTFHPSDVFEEADVSKSTVTFLYSHRDEYVFCKKGKPGDRFSLSKERLGDATSFLKENQDIDALVFNNEVINISLPVKLNFEVTEAPPGIKGDTAQGGTKTVKIETGYEINVPLFINQGDIIEINTEKGEYVRRVEKK